MRPVMLGASPILRTTPEAGACIDTDTKPSGLRDPLAARHLLALLHHRHRRLAHVLDQRDDQHRGERELADRQPARLVLRLRRVNAVTEGLQPQQSHADPLGLS